MPPSVTVWAKREWIVDMQKETVGNKYNRSWLEFFTKHKNKAAVRMSFGQLKCLESTSTVCFQNMWNRRGSVTVGAALLQLTPVVLNLFSFHEMLDHQSSIILEPNIHISVIKLGPRSQSQSRAGCLPVPQTDGHCGVGLASKLHSGALKDGWSFDSVKLLKWSGTYTSWPITKLNFSTLFQPLGGVTQTALDYNLRNQTISF